MGYRISLFLSVLHVIYVQVLPREYPIYNKLINKLNSFTYIDGHRAWDKRAVNVKYLVAPGLLSNNKHCREDSEVYWNELQKGVDAEEWAATMLDSSGTILPNGLPFLETASWGNYRHCTSINANINTTNTIIKGRHCLMHISFTYVRGWSRLKGYVNLFGKNNENELTETERHILQAGMSLWKGLCVPASCCYDDIQKGTLAILDSFKLRPSSGNCAKREEEREFSKGAIFAFILLIVWGTFIIGATISDIVLRREYQETKVERNNVTAQQKKQGNKKACPEDRCVSLIRCFSLITNGEKLLQTRPTNELDFFNGLRFFSRNAVVWGLHISKVVVIHAAKKNNVYRNYPYWLSQMMLTSGDGVDIFLYTSGFFATLSFLHSMKGKTEWKSILQTILKNYWHRYLRLAPAYAWLIFLFLNVFPYIDNGPLWTTATEYQFDKCSKHWWTNLLYINKIEQDGGCLEDTWFMSTDMHLFILTPVVLIPFFYNKRLGSLWMLFVYLAVTTHQLLSKFCDQVPLVGGKSLCNLRRYQIPFFDAIDSRAPAFLGGIICGCLYIFKPKRRIHQPILAFVWIASFILLGWILLSGTQGNYFEFGSFYRNRSFSFFIHCHAVVIFMLWFGFACTQGYTDGITAFLSWTPFQVINKLMYWAYLLSFPVRLWSYSSTKEAILYDDTAMVSFLMGQWFCIYFFALVFHLCLECPTNGLINMIRDTFTKPKPKLKSG